MASEELVQLALPLEVLEELLRSHQLHLEQLHSLDVASHRAIQRVVKQALSRRR